MASTIGGSGSSGARRSRERGLAVGSVEQAEHPVAVKRARVSAGASRSRGKPIVTRPSACFPLVLTWLVIDVLDPRSVCVFLDLQIRVMCVHKVD
jgi:hypothetical protein